jgi:hypothetical protein
VGWQADLLACCLLPLATIVTHLGWAVAGDAARCALGLCCCVCFLLLSLVFVCIPCVISTTALGYDCEVCSKEHQIVAAGCRLLVGGSHSLQAALVADWVQSYWLLLAALQGSDSLYIQMGRSR